MGTNYYLKQNVCGHCQRGDGPLHIGKSSAGWAFSLHVDHQEGIHGLEGWVKLFDEPENRIEDEYGTQVSKEEMLGIIRDRKGDLGKQPFRDPFYSSLSDMLDKNYAVLSEEFGLLRFDPTKKGSGCVGHGDGPWDLITGEFS